MRQTGNQISNSLTKYNFPFSSNFLISKYQFCYSFNSSHCSRLITGALQLAEGSHLIFDETHLEAGTLNSVGVENARVLKTLMELQKVIFCFIMHMHVRVYLCITA